MSKSKALTERERLQHQLTTCNRSGADASRSEAEAKAEKIPLAKALAAARQDAARGEDAVEKIAEIKDQIARATAAEKEAGHQRTAASVAAEEARNELRWLLATDPRPFVREAQDATDAAMKARGQAIAALQVAAKADKEARDLWTPLREAVQTQPQDDRKVFGGKSGFDLGQLPRLPASLDKGPDELKQAPPPAPAHIRQPNRFAGLLPSAVRSLFGVKDPEPRPEDDWQRIERVETSPTG